MPYQVHWVATDWTVSETASFGAGFTLSDVGGVVGTALPVFVTSGTTTSAAMVKQTTVRLNESHMVVRESELT
ncbi:hypothetical protein BS329_03945 [Amycolatopsis coloradensis]|uniref:Uncharacterized protein n=1 Tax=Amycolatopsis coloradensis TaxID=76021 RepID=A0A1R0L049_9PSEU|nr:hypothetical protein BS329_03945 [Amycolatopsis coloradensis]